MQGKNQICALHGMLHFASQPYLTPLNVGHVAVSHSNGYFDLVSNLVFMKKIKPT